MTTLLIPLFQHKYHTKIDDLIDRTLGTMKVGLTHKLLSVLDSVMSKLGRYDEGTVIGSFLSFTVSFLRQMDSIRVGVIPILDFWYSRIFVFFKHTIKVFVQQFSTVCPGNSSHSVAYLMLLCLCSSGRNAKDVEGP